MNQNKDQKNQNTSAPGARRFYSRDPESGSIVGEIILGNDGTITLKNDKVSQTIAADGSASLVNELGSSVLQANGNFVINGVTIDTDGNIDSPGTITGDTDVVGGGISVKDHLHDGSPTAPDGPKSPTGKPIT